MGWLWLPVIVTLLFWWYAYLEWLQEWLWRKPKFLKVLCSTGAPIFVGWVAYMFFELKVTGVVLGLAFAGPLILVVGIHLVCFAVEAVKGQARGKVHAK